MYAFMFPNSGRILMEFSGNLQTTSAGVVSVVASTDFFGRCLNEYYDFFFISYNYLTIILTFSTLF